MFEIAEYIGIIAFAMSGFFIGVRNNLDLLGVFIATFLTALGGGIVRDVIVDRTPYTFANNPPAIIVLVVMTLLILFKYHQRDSIENKPLFLLSDTIGLVSFSITGALIAMEAGLNATGVLALAFVTAVGGGIVRDVIINEVPFVFKTGFYGMVSLLVAIFLYLLNSYEMMSTYSIMAVFVVCVVIRLVAIYRKWSIPLI